jgi:FeS assembly SUF system protein
MEEKRQPLDIPAGAVSAAAADSQSTAPSTLEESIVEELRTVYDPEIPVNIYDLGLIYDIGVEGGDVAVKMTLTAPGCPVAGEMPGMVEVAVRRVTGVETCDVELVWDPPWNPDMMSEEARLTLNI